MFPVAFLGHGSPLTALEDGPYQQALGAWGRALSASTPRPSAVVVVSAHGFTRGGLRVGSAARHTTLHDFQGFPEALSALRYDAPGDPERAARIAWRLNQHPLLRDAALEATVDPQRGLDHGIWTPLRFVFPGADIPVVPVTLPWIPEASAGAGASQGVTMEQAALAVGEVLGALRREDDVLVVGSGNLTHNLRELAFDTPEAPPEAWALAFEAWALRAAQDNETDTLARWREDAPFARRAHPTPDHWLPLLTAVGAAAVPGRAMGLAARGRPIFQGMRYGTLSMTSLEWGEGPRV